MKTVSRNDTVSGSPSTAKTAEGAKRTSADTVAEKVGWGIMTQRYRPGARMREQDLSVEYGVSRTVIRDVIGKLAARGFLQIHPWRGATVVQYSREELRDLLDLNTTIYGFIAELAAERITDDDLAAMERILAEMTQLADETDTPEVFHKSRVDFYAALNRATGPFLSARRRANFPLTFYHQHVLADALTHAARKAQVAFFTEFLGHLQARDGAAAAATIRADFRKKRDIILASMEDAESGKGAPPDGAA